MTLGDNEMSVTDEMRAAGAKALKATLAEMSEAIPPAYTQHIGEQLIAHLQSERLAA